MKILMRNQDNGKWGVVDSAEYSAETELQALLAESPLLIDISEVRESASPLLVAVREVGLPGSGSTDPLAFNQEGGFCCLPGLFWNLPNSTRLL